MKERKKVVFATVICIFAVASTIFSFFDQSFLGITVIFGFSLFMVIQNRTALIPKKRISFIRNDFKRPFQAFGMLKEYYKLTWALSILFFVVGVLSMFILIHTLITS